MVRIPFSSTGERQTRQPDTTALVALHTAIYDPGLILLVSPSLRQSKELFAKVTGFLKDLEPAEVLEEAHPRRSRRAKPVRLCPCSSDVQTSTCSAMARASSTSMPR